MDDKDKKSTTPVAVNINLDTTPILYTDSIFMSVNPYGLTLDITQKVGDQVRIVSRIGMSREHAKRFVTELGKLLAMTEGQNRTDEKPKN